MPPDAELSGNRAAQRDENLDVPSYLTLCPSNAVDQGIEKTHQKRQRQNNEPEPED